MPTQSPEVFVAYWHAGDGHHAVLASMDAKALRLVVLGYPVILRKVPLTELRHLKRRDYPVRKAARRMRAMARNNASSGVKRFLDAILAC